MRPVERFSYTLLDPAQGMAGELPYLPIELSYQGDSVKLNGLVDSGASTNVMPYHIGLQLGAIWENQRVRLTLSGNLAQVKSRAVAAEAKIGNLEPVILGFAWASTENVPLILGQINFFEYFDVCFHRSRKSFEVRPAGTNPIVP